jgi:hypothetical protein
VTTTGGMHRVTDPSTELAWLADRPVHEGATGYAPGGWEASTWVLSALHERRRRGWPWRRVTWAEYLRRPGNDSGIRSVPPSYRWFDHPVTRPTVRRPDEGSLDLDSFTVLLSTLAGTGPDGARSDCYAYWGVLAASVDWPAHGVGQGALWTGPVSALPELLLANGGRYATTPTNVWPADRSWFVWTDWDLDGTRVSGSAGLVDAVRRHPALETTSWPEAG